MQTNRIPFRIVLGSMLACMAMLSCSVRKSVTEDELKTYLLNSENGLHKSVSKGDIEIEATYRPAELVWAQELKEMKDKTARDEMRKSYDSLNYFVLHFSRKGHEVENAFVSDPGQFTQLINYLSFDMSKDLYLVQEQDTTRAVDVVYARTFGGSTATSVMAIFNGDLNKKNENIKICFDDTMLGVGMTEFEFKISDIKKTPTLILN